MDLGLTAPDVTYSGTAYDSWTTTVDRADVTVRYYDLQEQRELGTDAPKGRGSYRLTAKLAKDGQVGEESANFAISPKGTIVCNQSCHKGWRTDSSA